MTIDASWFRQGARFHFPREDWVRSGRAVCGADIRNPGWATTSPEKTRHGACQHCLKVVQAVGTVRRRTIVKGGWEDQETYSAGKPWMR